MRTLFLTWFLLISSLLFAQDDVYYNSQTDQQIVSSFDFDDYYDYAYTSRIRRFHSNYRTWNYYDPYYTNIYYYDYDPRYWGNSIYLGYTWWSPQTTTIVWWGRNNWNWYTSYYYRPYYYSYWGNPWWYSRGYHWHNNWNYSSGYWNGYYNGLAQSSYSNSYDAGSNYYGPRRNSSVSGNRQSTFMSSSFTHSDQHDKIQPINNNQILKPNNNFNSKDWSKPNIISKPVQESRPVQNYSRPQESRPVQNYSRPQQNYSKPAQNNSRPQQNYSKPAQNNSRPQESRPVQNYSRPQQNYSKPAQNNSRPINNLQKSKSR